MDVTFYVEERHAFEGTPPFPWSRPPVGWRTMAAACHSMEHMISTEAGRRAGSDRGFTIEHRIVKVTTVVVVRDDEDIDYTRASGHCTCGACGMKYYDHPMAEEILGWQDLPWLHRLCDGRLVKL